MQKHLDELLVQKFPNLYKDRYADMRQTALCWGLECGGGWFNLIYDVSEKLEAEILKLPEEDRKHCCASQVKEKYASLRLYMTSSTDEMDKIIGEACRESARTCEVCGGSGRIRGMYWLECRCLTHANYYDLNFKEKIAIWIGAVSNKSFEKYKLNHWFWKIVNKIVKKDKE